MKNEIGVSLIDAIFKVDTSNQCPRGMGTIENCGYSTEGSMFHFCSLGDVGENICPQVIIRLSIKKTRIADHQLSQNNKEQID